MKRCRQRKGPAGNYRLGGRGWGWEGVLCTVECTPCVFAPIKVCHREDRSVKGFGDDKRGERSPGAARLTGIFGKMGVFVVKSIPSEVHKRAFTIDQSHASKIY